jgi:putative membrane protein
MTTASQGRSTETRLMLPPAIAHGESRDLVSVELSARRTGMSFQRTRMSADRTLMSVIRTSLALITFGFTIFQFFQRLQEKNTIGPNGHSARNFGMALIYLGIAMVFVGIVYHIQFMVGLRRERADMNAEGLIHAQSGFPLSFTLVVALLLLLLGIAAAASLTFRIGPFD